MTAMEEIHLKLMDVCPDVFYGVADDKSEATRYITWFRESSDLNSNHTSKTRKFRLGYVCKNFVPETAEEDIRSALEEIPGCRVSGDHTYNFAIDTPTGSVYEVLQMHFSISEKV